MERKETSNHMIGQIMQSIETTDMFKKYEDKAFSRETHLSPYFSVEQPSRVLRHWLMRDYFFCNIYKDSVNLVIT